MKQQKKNTNVIKRLSREASLGNSFGDYHQEAPASIPFTWESQPGTPKHVSHDQRPLPPLTPPPSYSYGGGTSRQSKPTKHLIQTLFPRISTSSRKGGREISTSSVSFPPSPSSSSQWSSSSSSTSGSSPANNGSMKYFHGRRRSRQKMTSFDSSLEEEDEDFSEIPVSELFYVGAGTGTERMNRALYKGCCSGMMRLFKG